MADFYKQCKYHGYSRHRFVKRKNQKDREQCCECQTISVKKRRIALKQKAINYKGGCCVVCGYNKCFEALEFHHIDPNEKEFSIGFKGETRSWERNKVELDKCILLCSNCHRELHAGIIAL